MAQRDQFIAGVVTVVHFAGPGLYLREKVVRSMIGIVRREALRVLDSSPR